MNIKNALGFVVLGLAMYAVPTFVQAFGQNGFSDQMETSTQMIWLTFMGWVVTNVGIAYLAREGVMRLPAWWATTKAEPWVRFVLSRPMDERLPEGARISVSK